MARNRAVFRQVIRPEALQVSEDTKSFSLLSSLSLTPSDTSPRMPRSNSQKVRGVRHSPAEPRRACSSPVIPPLLSPSPSGPLGRDPDRPSWSKTPEILPTYSLQPLDAENELPVASPPNEPPAIGILPGVYGITKEPSGVTVNLDKVYDGLVVRPQFHGEGDHEASLNLHSGENLG